MFFCTLYQNYFYKLLISTHIFNQEMIYSTTTVLFNKKWISYNYNVKKHHVTATLSVLTAVPLIAPTNVLNGVVHTCAKSTLPY